MDNDPVVPAHVGLSPREVQILDLIARGRTNDEICREMYLSINTIKTYIRTAYQKVGVTTRVQAVLWALHHGLGDPGLGPVDLPATGSGVVLASPADDEQSAVREPRV